MWQTTYVTARLNDEIIVLKNGEKRDVTSKANKGNYQFMLKKCLWSKLKNDIK